MLVHPSQMTKIVADEVLRERRAQADAARAASRVRAEDKSTDPFARQAATRGPRRRRWFARHRTIVTCSSIDELVSRG